MAIYKNYDDKLVLVQRAGPAESNVYSLKDDSFVPQGDYTLAMYDENNNYIGRTMNSAPARINSDDFHGYKKPFLSSKFKGTILFIKGSLDKMTERVVLCPTHPTVLVRSNGVDRKVPLVGNIVLQAGVNFPDLAKLLNRIGVLRKKGGADLGICMSLENFTSVLQLILDKTFKSCSFSEKILEGTMREDKFNLLWAPGNAQFAKYFVKAFNDTAGRMDLPTIHISAIGG